MNLQQTIDELEEQARQYREAAEKLRALANTSTPAPVALPRSSATEAPAAQKSASRLTKKPGSKIKASKTVSDETRAKISEKLKAAHAARKAAASA